MLPEGALLLERGWVIEEVVAIYVECGGYKEQGVQIPMRTRDKSSFPWNK